MEDIINSVFGNYLEYFEDVNRWSGSAAYNVARISCFSSSADNLLMWSHYADGLRGFCLEIDEAELKTEERSWRAHVFDVVYSANPPVIDLVVFGVLFDQYEWNTFEESFPEALAVGLKAKRGFEAILRKMVATKPIQWEYERERRLVVMTEHQDRTRAFEFDYRPEAVSGVVVGERMPKSHRKLLDRAMRAGGIDVPIRTASRDSSSFRISIQ